MASSAEASASANSLAKSRVREKRCGWEHGDHACVGGAERGACGFEGRGDLGRVVRVVVDHAGAAGALAERFEAPAGADEAAERLGCGASVDASAREGFDSECGVAGVVTAGHGELDREVAVGHAGDRVACGEVDEGGCRFAGGATPARSRGSTAASSEPPRNVVKSSWSAARSRASWSSSMLVTTGIVGWRRRNERSDSSASITSQPSSPPQCALRSPRLRTVPPITQEGSRPRRLRRGRSWSSWSSCRAPRRRRWCGGRRRAGRGARSGAGCRHRGRGRPRTPGAPR